MCVLDYCVTNTGRLSPQYTRVDSYLQNSLLFYPFVDKCEVEADVGFSVDCTPVRGYMTAWLPPGSSNADTARTEAELLTSIEKGMTSDPYTSDPYTSDDVVKALYARL